MIINNEFTNNQLDDYGLVLVNGGSFMMGVVPTSKERIIVVLKKLAIGPL
jgi:hypothetical protein